MIITCYITGEELRPEQKREMTRYLINKQSKDGGWGIHTESGSTIFGSALNYVSLRYAPLLIFPLLSHCSKKRFCGGGRGEKLFLTSLFDFRLMGMSKDHPTAVKGRKFLQEHGIVV